MASSFSATAVPSDCALLGGPSLFPGRDGHPSLPRPLLTLRGERAGTLPPGGDENVGASWALSETLGGGGGRAPQPGQGVGGFAALCVWAKRAVGLPGWAALSWSLSESSFCWGSLPSPGPPGRSASFHTCRVILSVVPEVLAALDEG